MKHYRRLSKNLKINKSDILCLDIEVSSYWMQGSTPISYDSAIPDDKYNEMDAGAVCYIWMLGINDEVYYGRELKQLLPFLNKLSDRFVDHDKHIIWIHNLSYEFQFLINYIQFEEVFARNERHPMKATAGCYEFRCTYNLTHMSLAKWSESTNVKKLTGFLDYRVLRTPKSKLDDKALAYCEHDILVMYEGLQPYIKRYKDQEHIPLTQTGEVRKVLKNKVKRNNKYHRLCTRLVPNNANLYKTMRKAFAGGDTHAYIEIVGNIEYNIASFDETSAYPSMIFRKKFPMQPFTECPASNFDYNKYAYLMVLRLKGVKHKTYHHYISRSRMVSCIGDVCENGRVLEAEEISCCITEQDLILIQKTYDIKEIEYVKVYRSRKGYLPLEYVELVLDFFRNKTTLRGVDNELYMLSKQLLNSLFGMSVTDLMNALVSFDSESNIWSTKDITDDDINNVIIELKNKPYKNVLSYAWGLYITSYNRTELWNCILSIGSDVVYYDTDSVKFKHPKLHLKKFEERNKAIILESVKACKARGIPEDSFIAYTPKGEKSILGVWDNEGDRYNIAYDEFISLGAKKYAYKHDGKIGITVSGVPKKAAKCLKSLEDFKTGFYFDRDVCGKNQVKYIDGDNPLVILNKGKYDEYKVKERYGINIKNAGYTLGMTDEFVHIINSLREKGWSI